LVKITTDGGAGEDTLLGSNGADVISGGDDNDFIDGQQGNDTVSLGDGDDTFQWDPGDGLDIVEGQAGNDTLLFNGSAGSEIFEASANGTRVRFTRNLGNIVMDLDDVENLDLKTLVGTDLLTVNDLTGTDLTNISANLAGTIGGNTGDAQADNVIINCTTNNDVVYVTNALGVASVFGLSAKVTISNSEPAHDRLTVNTLGGDDVVDASEMAAGIIALTADSGDDDDILLGSAGADTLLGGAGDDVLLGGPGIDFLDGGPGDNIIIQD
jgi:Ca2+-binding RTX toxin-like protein